MLMQLPLFLVSPEGAAQGGSSSLLSMAPILIMILIFYFLIMRPQSKKQKETKRMLEAIKKGDKITTIGGIRGTVDSIKDDVVTVMVNGNTKIDFVKSSISIVSNPVADAQINGKKEK